MAADPTLIQAQELVDALAQRLDDPPDESRERFVPSLEYTPTTLAVLIGDVLLWDDQNDDPDDLTEAYCWDKWLDHCRELARYVPPEPPRTA